MIAGSLEIQLLANVARLQQDMNQAKGMVQSTMRDISSAVEQAKGVLASLGLTATVGGMALLAKNAIDAADSLNDLSKSTGLAVEKLAGLRLASKQSGGDLDGIANSINKLSVNIGKSGEKFAALGITAKDPLEAFKQFADVFASIDDPQLRAALGAEALGKSWASSAPLLAEGGKKIGEMVEKGERLSGVTKDLAEQSDAFNDKLAELAGNGGMVNGMLGQMLPLLNSAADGLLAMRDNGGGAGSILGSVLTEALRVVIVLAGNVGFVLRGIGNEIGGIAAQVVAFLSGDFKRAAEIGRMMTADAEAARAKFDAWEASIMAVGTAATSTAAATKGMSAEDLEAARIAKDAATAASAKAKAFLAGADAAQKAAKAQKELGLADAHVVAFLKQEAALRESVAKALEQGTEERRKYLGAIEDEIERQERQNETLGMTRTQIAGLTVARLEERMAILKASGAMETEIAQLQEEIDLRKKLADAVGRGETGRAAIEAQSIALRDQVSIWSELSHVAADFFVDLATNGREAFDNLREWLKRFLAEMLAVFAQKWVLQLGASLVGGSGGGALSSAAGQVGQGTLTGAASNYIGSLLTGTGSIGTAVGQTAIMQFYGGATGAISGPGLTGAAGLGQQATGWASANLGALGIVGAIIAVGMWAMDLYKSGWRDTGSARDNAIATGGFSGIQQVDNKLLKMLGFSDRDAFTMSGGPIISRLFGWKARQNDAFGIRGSFGGSGITGENWQEWSEQGGLFRSDRRGTRENGEAYFAAFSPEQAAFFAQVFKGIGGITGAAGSLVGVNSSALLAGYSKPFDFQLNENGEPLSDEALAKLFGDYFGAVLQEQVAMVFDAGGRGELAEYVKALKGSGEEITGFISELVAVMGALDQADILGMRVEDLMKFKLEGETLTQTFQRVGGAWAQFKDIFYTDAEKIASVQADVSKVFADLGIAMPTTNEGFRALVESLDLSTESGRKMFTALMGVAPAFAAITNAAEAAVARFNSLATTLSPSFGAANARSVLEARVQAWMGLTPANGAAGGWDVGSTIDNIGRMVREGRIGEALTYAQSLGGNAVTVLNDMLEAYIAWTTAMQNAQGPVRDIGAGLGNLGDAAERAAAQMQGAKDGLWAYLQGLYTNPALSPLDPMQQLGVARGQFFDQLALAQGGDVGAASGLQGYIDRVLGLGRTAFGSAPGYISLFEEITRAAADFARPGGANELQAGIYAEARTGNDLMREVRQILLDIRDKGTADGETVAGAVENASAATSRR